MSATAPPLVAFKKPPRSRPVQSRRRSTSPSAVPFDPSSSTSVVRPERKSLANPLIQGNKRRRDESDSAPALDDDDFRADSTFNPGDTYATRSTDYDLESAPPPPPAQKVRLNDDGEIMTDDGLYRGASNYLPTINKTREVLDKKMKTGPIRATANVRTITLMDYQPDVCKDYKETGFCGYGDSCKFLHDRGDYRAGWQLEDPSETVVAPVEEEEEEVPFACLICRKPFTEPVATKCGHYFCMQCAIDRFVKSPKCYACGAATSGIFNKAEKILAKMEARNKKKREARGVVDEETADDGIQIGGADDDDEDQGDD